MLSQPLLLLPPPDLAAARPERDQFELTHMLDVPPDMALLVKVISRCG